MYAIPLLCNVCHTLALCRRVAALVCIFPHFAYTVLRHWCCIEAVVCGFGCGVGTLGTVALRWRTWRTGLASVLRRQCASPPCPHAAQRKWRATPTPGLEKDVSVSTHGGSFCSEKGARDGMEPHLMLQFTWWRIERKEPSVLPSATPPSVA